MIKFCNKCQAETKRNTTGACLACNASRAAKYRKANKAKCAAAEKGYRNRNPERVSFAREVYLAANPEMAAKFIATRKAKDAQKSVCHLKADRDAAVIADLKAGMSATDAGLRYGISRQYALKLGSEHTRKAKEAVVTQPFYGLYAFQDAMIKQFSACMPGTVRTHAVGF